MIRTINQVPIIFIGGKEPDDKFNGDITVTDDADPNSRLVVLNFNNIDITVGADDLIKAINNAINK
jgi:hypothetical protein